jgi:hypothetical protein
MLLQRIICVSYTETVKLTADLDAINEYAIQLENRKTWELL